MNCETINWMAAWVAIAIGIGIGMAIAAIFKGGSDGGRR